MRIVLFLLVCQHIVTSRTLTVAQVLCLSSISFTCAHEVSDSLRLCSHLLPHTPPVAFLPLLPAQLVDYLLRTPHKESMDLFDEFCLRTRNTLFIFPPSLSHLETVCSIVRHIYGRSPKDDLKDFNEIVAT